MRLVLASKSETRRRMLEAAGVAFEAAVANVAEEEAKAGLGAVGFDARGTAEMLAEIKAKGVVSDGLVLGADQTLELDTGEMLSKAGSREELADQLRAMSGRMHFLHSAAAIVEGGEPVWRGSETASMHVRPLSDRFIDDYLDFEYEAVRWNVGGYRFEGLGAQLFEAVEGSHFAVLGLPLLPLLAYLRERGMMTS